MANVSADESACRPRPGYHASRRPRRRVPRKAKALNVELVTTVEGLQAPGTVEAIAAVEALVIDQAIAGNRPEGSQGPRKSWSSPLDAPPTPPADLTAREYPVAPHARACPSDFV
jgi:hypothetical protein